jgi:hypothetical protein
MAVDPAMVDRESEAALKECMRHAGARESRERPRGSWFS